VKDGSNVDPETLQLELVRMVRESVGPFANFRRAVVVRRLPKTRSGKILPSVFSNKSGHKCDQPECHQIDQNLFV
jgi:acyl-coenzyme A synthetase/AMP-(fatty) acid ligase